MKVLLVTSSLSPYAGWGRYTVEVGEELSRRGHEVFSAVSEKVDTSALPQHQILDPPLSLLSNPVKCFQSAIKLRRLVRDLKPDLIHITVEPYVAVLPICYLGNTRCIVSIHGTYAKVPLLQGFVIRWLNLIGFMRVDVILCGSPFTRSVFENALGKLWAGRITGKIKYVPYGINLDRFPKAFGKKNNTSTIKRILFVGEIKKRKGVLEAIQACCLLRNKYGVPFEFHLIGRFRESDPYVKTLHDFIKKNSLESQVIFRGRVSETELQEAYNSADLFMMLSIEDNDRFEGFGLVFLEANARGIPVIGPNTGGCPEAISHGNSGFICDPFETEEISAKMRDILISNVITAEECRAWAEANDIRRTVEHIEETYRKSFISWSESGQIVESI
jgi:phosphatidyl-myo-inositol dimannoside synthase